MTATGRARVCRWASCVCFGLCALAAGCDALDPAAEPDAAGAGGGHEADGLFAPVQTSEVAELERDPTTMEYVRPDVQPPVKRAPLATEDPAIPPDPTPDPVPVPMELDPWNGELALLDDVHATYQTGEHPNDWVVVWDTPFSVGVARQGLSVTPDGRIYLAFQAFGETIATTSTAFVQQLDSSGQPLWTRAWHTGRAGLGEQSFAVIALPDGGAVVGGQYSRPGDGCETPGFDRGCTDAFLTRFDEQGEELWTLGFGNRPELDRVLALAPGTGSVVFATGQYNGVIELGDDVVLESRGGIDQFVLAIDVDSQQVLWARTIGTEDDDLDGPSLAAMPEGVTLVGNPQTAAASSLDARVERLDDDGHTRWSWDGPVDTPDGAMVWAGRAASGGDGRLWLGAGLLTLAGRAPYYGLFELDAAGQELGRFEFGSPDYGAYGPYGLLPLEDGRVVLVGRYGEQPLFADTEELVTELYVLHPDGELVRVDTHPRWDFPTLPVLSHDGAVLMAGAFERSTTFGLGIDPIDAAGRDLYLMRRGVD